MLAFNSFRKCNLKVLTTLIPAHNLCSHAFDIHKLHISILVHLYANAVSAKANAFQ